MIIDKQLENLSFSQSIMIIEKSPIKKFELDILYDIKSSEISIIRIIQSFYRFEGGHANHVKELSEQIDPFLKKQIIITSDVGDLSKGFDKTYPIPIIRLKSRKLKNKWGIPVTPINDFFFMIEVFRYIKTKERPDIIHAHGINPIIYASIIGKILDIPVVGMIHGSLSAYHKISGVYETIIAMLFKPDWALILDSGTIAPLKFCSLWKNRTTIVYHGINTDIYKPQIKNENLIQKFELDAYEFIVLSINNLIPVKNIDLSIDAFEFFLKSIAKKNVCLLIAGDGFLKEQLIEIVKKRKLDQNVRFLGRIDSTQIPDYIAIADVCIGTSLKDSMSRSILEPMAAGKPVIAFNCGGINKLVKTGVNGLLAVPRDIFDFSEKLKILYDNPELREKIGKNARNTIIEQRSWESRLKIEIELYHKILTGKYGKKFRM